MNNRFPKIPENANHAPPSVFTADRESFDAITSSLLGKRNQVESLVREYPLSSLGAAVCLGMVIGWIMKRR